MKKKRGPGILETMRAHKGTAAVYMILRFLVLATMISQFIYGNYENVFLCLLTLVLFMLPQFVSHSFDLELSGALQIIVLLFIFSAEILGEINEFYIVIPMWDSILHTINGFMAAAIGFAMVDILNNEERISLSLSPFFMAVMAFCFSMTIGVLWEFFEFGMDSLFGMDMQKDTVINAINSVNLDPDGHNIVSSVKDIEDVILKQSSGETRLGLGGYLDIGLMDTMSDLFVNFIGALVFSVIGYFYVKSRGKNKYLDALIMKRRHERKDKNGLYKDNKFHENSEDEKSP